MIFTSSTYQIDVFTPEPASLVSDPVTNPDFIGRITRPSMGKGSTRGGKIKPKAMRALYAEAVAYELDGEELHVKQVVADVATDLVADEALLHQWACFRGRLLWLGKS